MEKHTDSKKYGLRGMTKASSVILNEFLTTSSFEVESLWLEDMLDARSMDTDLGEFLGVIACDYKGCVSTEISSLDEAESAFFIYKNRDVVIFAQSKSLEHERLLEVDNHLQGERLGHDCLDDDYLEDLEQESSIDIEYDYSEYEHSSDYETRYN